MAHFSVVQVFLIAAILLKSADESPYRKNGRGYILNFETVSNICSALDANEPVEEATSSEKACYSSEMATIFVTFCEKDKLSSDGVTHIVESETKHSEEICINSLDNRD